MASPPKNQQSLLKLGPDVLWVGEVAGGRPHGIGDLILGNNSVHHGSFVDGRASGPGCYFDAAGTVTTGEWLDNKRVGAFVTIDPKGGEWADTYDAESGKRVARKKRAPPPADAAGVSVCIHCKVKFHPSHNSCCRQHKGQWMQADGDGGGMWLCCGSKSRRISASA